MLINKNRNYIKNLFEKNKIYPLTYELINIIKFNTKYDYININNQLCKNNVNNKLLNEICKNKIIMIDLIKKIFSFNIKPKIIDLENLFKNSHYNIINFFLEKFNITPNNKCLNLSLKNKNKQLINLCLDNIKYINNKNLLLLINNKFFNFKIYNYKQINFLLENIQNNIIIKNIINKSKVNQNNYEFSFKFGKHKLFDNKFIVNDKCLFNSCIYGDIDIIKNLLSDNKLLINSKCINFAFKNKKIELIKLFSKYINFNLKNLFLWINNNELKNIYCNNKIILKNKYTQTNINYSDKNIQTNINYDNKNVQTVNFIIKKNNNQDIHNINENDVIEYLVNDLNNFSDEEIEFI